MLARSKEAYLRLQVADHEACNDLLGGEVGEGDLTGEHLPQHHTQAPHISLLAHTLRVRHQLWSHVGKSSPAHHKNALDDLNMAYRCCLSILLGQIAVKIATAPHSGNLALTAYKSHHGTTISNL